MAKWVLEHEKAEKTRKAENLTQPEQDKQAEMTREASAEVKQTKAKSACKMPIKPQLKSKQAQPQTKTMQTPIKRETVESNTTSITALTSDDLNADLSVD